MSAPVNWASVLRVGVFLQCLTFFIICLVVYFIVVLPINALLNKFYVSLPSLSPWSFSSDA